MNEAALQDGTCDPALVSWIPSAEDADTDFPLQNLPFGIFLNPDDGVSHVCTAIGDQLLDLHGLADDGLLAGIANETADACRNQTLNHLASLGRGAQAELRQRLSQLLQSTASTETRDAVSRHLRSQSEAAMQLPFAIGDYSDFYSSIEHATRAGQIFRPDKPLLPNYKYVPIAYHGRASSVVVSGTPIHRPWGQQQSGEQPVFAPTGRLDYEAELGLFIGAGNALGTPIPVREADQHMFGVCLLNDWSARDIQSWEYQPLGPFLGKNFATSISPWIVSMDALAPFRAAAAHRAPDDPAPLLYLYDDQDQQRGNFAIQIEVRLQTSAMRERNQAPVVLSISNTADLYWTPAQWIAHHTSNGCNLRPGDLLGSGTVSGISDASRACLLELTSGGKQCVHLPDGEERMYLQDGDEVILAARCVREGCRTIGLGSCRAVVQPAQS